MASRQSIDSTYSTSPLIQGPASQPHPEDHASHGKAVGENTGTKVRVSTVIAIFRLLALISGVAIGTSFALLGAWRVQTIVPIVLTWISVAWNGLMLASLARKPSLRISLVFRDSDIIQFGSQSEGNRGKKCRCRYPRAFWVDLFLVSAVIALNVAQGLLGDWYYWDYYHTTVSLNWFTTYLLSSYRYSTHHVPGVSYSPCPLRKSRDAPIVTTVGRFVSAIRVRIAYAALSVPDT